MKTFWKEFFFRGLICAAGGPLVLAVIYGILGATEVIAYLSPNEVCIGIISIAMLAFIAAGMTAIYQMEQLPLTIMILLHGGALYLVYLFTYLLNGWLLSQLVPILIFTCIFVVGYAFIWSIIYCIERKKISKLNQMLKN